MNISEAERVLESSPDHRILRRIPPVANWGLRGSSNDVRRAVFVDVETTGLDQDRDEVIELALLPFSYDRHSGEIIEIMERDALNELREPSIPIPPESTRIHGISDADVKGKSIDANKVEAIVSAADLILAHNAAFDRPMVEKLWPVFERKHWACSLQEIDWKAEGLGSGKLDYLLMRLGCFYEAHRALGDALAGAFLLSRPLPTSRRPALQVLLERARRPLKAIRAEETAFAQRVALKQRGYRWDDGAGSDRGKAWWILTDDPDAEIGWLNASIYSKPRLIRPIAMPATRRYSARLWERR
ncbi:polymerase epsilon subunit [alpha proteobacterium U9-1i]|nr:polymerase epsilon subunit [alpha proteobacterium U9-1i]